jgi:peptidoglycan/LPS O-acetylase OafA/YrhL
MPPAELKHFGGSMASALGFVSNVFFWQSIDYFNPTAENYPLLHTWSLAIEEQFYIFFPIVLLITFKFFKRLLIPLVISGLIGSLCLAQWAAHEMPQANFFLLPTRAWELLAGAIIALTYTKLKNTPFAVAQILSGIGLIMLFASYFILDDTMKMPGFLTLIPVIGTCLIIAFATSGTLANKFLSIKTTIFIGLLSYSLYLWHQPIFAFGRLYFGDLSFADYAIFIGLTFGLSYLSWKYIEQPFRRKDLFTRRQIFTFFTASMIITGSIAALLYFSNGLPKRNDRMALIAEIESRLTRNAGLNEACNTLNHATPAPCQTSDSPQVLLWGDSYAMHLGQALIAQNPDIKLIQKTASICGPFFDATPIILPTYNAARAEKCLAFNNHVKNMINDTPSLQYAVLSSPFTGYIRETSKIYTSTQNWKAAKSFRQTLSWIKSQGVEPIVVSPPPRTGMDFKKCYKSKALLKHPVETCDFPIGDHHNFEADIITFLKNIETEGYRVIWLAETLCDGKTCRTYIPESDIYIYNDSGHLSIEGARYLGTQIDFVPSSFGLTKGSE